MQLLEGHKGALEANVCEVVQRELVQVDDAVVIEVGALELRVYVLLDAPRRLHVPPSSSHAL